MSNSLENNVIKTWGDKGRAWLKALPSIVHALTRYWNLSDLLPVKNLSYNYVMTGHQGITPIILKIACEQSEFKNEQSALTAYNGNSCIRLLDSNLEYNGLLLEQAIPGTSLVSFFPDRDNEALKLTVTIMQQLHAAQSPLGAHVPSIQDWFKDLFNPLHTSSSHHTHKAQEIARHLFATQPKSVLLHGDLHHGNILLSNHGWLAIDPKGIYGDPAFEICSFMQNPNPEVLQNKKLVLHRLALFSEYLSIDQERLQAWLYVTTVLDACWSMKEGQTDPKIAFAHAELVNAILSKF